MKKDTLVSCGLCFFKAQSPIGTRDVALCLKLPPVQYMSHDKTNKVTVRPAKTLIRWAHSHFVGFVMSRLILCERTSNALERLCECAVSHQTSLFTYVINNFCSWVGSNKITTPTLIYCLVLKHSSVPNPIQYVFLF